MLLKKTVVRLEALSVLLAFSLFTHPAIAQTYLGVGYTESPDLDNWALYYTRGIVIAVQKEVTLGQSQWRLVPALQTGLLFSDLYDKNFPVYSSTLSLSALVSYDVFRFKSITLSPYAGPFASWFASMEADKIGSLFAVERVNRLYGGIEVGLAAYFKITDQFHIKLIPLSGQIGNDYFRQPMIILAFKL